MLWQARQGFIGGRGAIDAASVTPFTFAALTAPAPDTTSQTTYTFSSADFGTADANRYIAVFFGTRNAGGTQASSSVTVGGVACSKVVSAANATSNLAEIWVTDTPVSSGTSGTITVVFVGANSRCAIQQYSIISPGTIVPSGAAIGSSTANNPTASVTIPTGGIAIGGAYTNSGGPGTPSATPTGFNNLDLNNNIAGTHQVYAFHSNAGVITGSQSLTMTLTGQSVSSGVFAAWGP